MILSRAIVQIKCFGFFCREIYILLMNVFTSCAEQRLKQKQPTNPTNMESPSMVFKKHPRMYFMTKGNVQNQNINVLMCLTLVIVQFPYFHLWIHLYFILL